MAFSPEPRSPRFWVALGWLTTVALGLVPWWRNHDYIRDFFDYGAMIVAAGRINTGQLPYVDWVSPLQSGSYWLNAWAERWLGGDYLGLTRGNAIFIPLAIGLLAATLRNRAHPVAAMVLVFCVVVGSASQHTMIWYNAIGAVTLAAIAWTTALHPAATRSAAGPTLLVVAMLILSGTNKINFHALALAIACAWTLRAGLLGHASWKRVGATLGLWLFAGLGLPVWVELQLTGATFAQWKANVIDLPFAAPGYGIERFLNIEFLLTPVHSYYGNTLKPVGLILVIWAAITIGLAWRRCAGWDRLLLIGAATMALGGTFALIATNHEIVYVGLASGVALLAAIWMGFGLWDCPRLRNGLLIAPAAVLAVIMLHSAWLGQRSQFGHSTVDRSDYLTFSTEDGAAYRYLVGTYMPPSIHKSLLKLEEFIPEPNEDGRVPVFYASGAEFLERLWPQDVLTDMPLLIASLTVSAERAKELSRDFGFPPRFKLLIGMTAWDGSWPGELGAVVRRNALLSWKVEMFSVSRFSGEGIFTGLPPADDAIQALNSFGGNLDPRYVTVDQPLWPFDFYENESQAVFLGTPSGTGSFLFERPSYRMVGKIAMRRPPASGNEPVAARFRVIDATIPEGDPGWLIQEFTRTLPAGEQTLIDDYRVDTRGRPVRFAVTLPEDSTDQVQAGFFLPEIQHSATALPTPPVMRDPHPPEKLNEDDVKTAVLPDGWQDQFKAVVRGGEISDSNQLLLFEGDELWLHSNEPVQELIGKISLTDTIENSGFPFVRVVWYRGGRIQQLHARNFEDTNGTLHFNTWPAEEKGWYGVLIDRGFSRRGLQVSIDHVRVN